MGTPSTVCKQFYIGKSIIKLGQNLVSLDWLCDALFSCITISVIVARVVQHWEIHDKVDSYFRYVDFIQYFFLYENSVAGLYKVFAVQLAFR